jgi:hypothetical protein
VRGDLTIHQPLKQPDRAINSVASETGFTGPVSELNRTTGSYPGSVRTRFSNRKPQSHAYAPLSPVLHYNPGQGIW